jgi:molybdate transport system ATP-binding protein
MTARLSLALHAVSVRRGANWVLRDISLELAAGERWALLGGNGAGKTQLLKLLCGDVWPTPTGEESRVYRVGQRPVDLIAAKRRIAYLGAELQDKYARYGWNLAVGDMLATGLHRSDLLLRPPTTTERRRVIRMLELCGLTPLAERKFLTLSYGQKRLALLARALVQRPDWLLLDEFYNGLDGEYRGRIDAILERLRAAGQAWVISAHRAGDVPHGTQQVIELRAGRVYRVAPLRAAALAHLAQDAGERPGRRHYARRPAAAAARGRPLVRITDADLYVDYRLVLGAVNWELRQGEQWAVVGANGAGKSSFLKLLYGDLSPALGGAIHRSGYPFGTPIAAWKRHVGYVSPELQTDYAIDVSVFELVASGRYASIGLGDAPTATDRRRALHWLKYFALSSLAARRPRELSYGQLRRALFARALQGGARILLLDEPLTGLDPRQRAAMKRLLEGLMRRRRTLVMAVHHEEDLPRGITHVLRLHDHAISVSAT